MKKAIVVGGSIAGLASAKALAPYFDEIIVLDADEFHDTTGARKGTPQASHVHGLLKGGGDALTSLFPMLPEKLREAGAVSADFSRDVRWYINERWMPRFPGSLPIFFQTRPVLERCIRDEARKLDNVEILTHRRIIDYKLDPDKKRVIAAVISHRDGASETIEADFFVDTSGRGSFLPKWLSENGFGTVREKRITVNLGYASCLMELPEDPDRDWSSLLIYPKGPHEIRGSTLVKVENNRWMLTLAGYHHDHPPSDIDGFLEFARTLPRPDIYNAVKGAEIVSSISLHKFPHGHWREYGKLARFPLGLLPVGDTNASLNPLFGQGMSAAALSAQSLGQLFKRYGSNLSEKDLEQLKTDYFLALKKILKTPWDLALGQDFRYPATLGDKPMSLRPKNILKDMVMGSSSEEIIERFFHIVHLVEEEKSLYHPKWALKYIAAKIKNPA
jgi:flavin-dependent dehydrogenase